MMVCLKKTMDRLAYHLPDKMRSFMERFYPRVAFITYYREITEDEYADVEHQRRRQFIKLKNLLKYAQEKVPYYRDLFNKIGFSADDFNHLSDLKNIPILSKGRFQEGPDLLLSSDFDKSKLLVRHTSGATGTPLRVFMTPQATYYRWATVKKQLAMAGVDFRDPSISIDKALSKNTLMRLEKDIMYINTLRFDAPSLDAVIDFLAEQKRFKFMTGLPTFFEILTKRIEERRILLRPVRAVITSGEHLTSENRERMERVFRCKVFNFYGMNEGVIYGLECAHRAGFHLQTGASFVEQIAGEGSGEGHRIIATGLNNYAMPLIRYDTGDIGVISEEEKCRCGRPGPILTKLLGRFSDLIRLADGTTYHFDVLSRALRDVSGIRESRFVQYSYERVVLEIARNGASLDRGKLERHLHKVFSNRIGWEIKEVPFIPRSGNGKVKFIHSDMT